MDESVFEAARDLGASPWRTFRHITLPLTLPGIVAGFLKSFTLSIDDFVITFFVAGVGVTTLPLRNLNPDYLNTWFDPGNRYSVPYAYTVTLIGYNAEKLRERNLPTNTWALIFEPKYLEKIKGRVSVMNSARKLMATAMIYLSYPVHDTDPAKWDEAKCLILRTKPYWATFSNSTYIKDLAIGNIWVAQGYSNDMCRASADAHAAERPFQIGFSIPREGAVLALDSFVIHRSGARPDLTHAFINFMLDGNNAADVSNLIGAGNPNAAAIPLIRREIAGNPAMFPAAARDPQVANAARPGYFQPPANVAPVDRNQGSLAEVQEPQR